MPGQTIFDLYQTNGIPVELLEEFAQEEGLALDREGFEVRPRGRAAAGPGVVARRFAGPLPPRVRVDGSTRDVGPHSMGYDTLSMTPPKWSALIGDDGLEDLLEKGESGEVVFDETPFYPEVGWADRRPGKAALGRGTGGRDRHPEADGRADRSPRSWSKRASWQSAPRSMAEVAEGNRMDTQRNHTATHLLHAALRKVLGEAAQQAGSLVDPDRLRFDFSWGEPVTREQLREIERLVNAEIVRNEPVAKEVMAMDDGPRPRRDGAVR